MHSWGECSLWIIMVIFASYQTIKKILWYMHGQNVEFGNLIPGKFCLWREIFANLRDIITFRWIFLSFSYKNVWKCVKKSYFWQTFWPYSREILHFFCLAVVYNNHGRIHGYKMWMTYALCIILAILTVKNKNTVV